ncbi:hypothetical protein, partial [Chryseobacterium gambrini]|uniref:hypothetical protein n=1 Tax=Chryseobacterium gambrini TaxID=373672 RepID=UPI003BA57A1D
ECFLGKEEVTGSSPVVGSHHIPIFSGYFFAFIFMYEFCLKYLKTFIKPKNSETYLTDSVKHFP